MNADEHQAWDGFGGCFNELGYIALSLLSPLERDRVMRSLFDPADGCRFSLCRVPIGASDYAAEWYSHNETDGDFEMARFSIERDSGYLIPYIRLALDLRKDLTIFASPWSPPTWMKRPRAYNYGTLIWEPRYLAAYARYFVEFVKAYRALGIPVTQVHPQNEPVADQKFPSCLWTGERLREFIGGYLGPAFRASGLDCEIWLGTINSNDYHGYPETVLSDPAARSYLTGVAFQWHGKELVQRTAASWPDLKLMQSENECGDGANSWAYAQYVFDLLQHYITNGVSSYCYWNMVLQPGGESTWGWRQNAMITVDPATRQATYNPEFYVMKHFAACIDPGAVRLGVSGWLSGSAVAFRNPDGRIAVVLQNASPAAREITVACGGGAHAVRLETNSFNTLIV